MKCHVKLFVVLASPLLLLAQPPADTPPGREGRQWPPGESRPQRERADTQRPARGQPFLERWLSQLKEADPDEHARLRELREENPAAFRAEVRAAFSRMRTRAVRQQRARAFSGEITAIREAETPEARQEAVGRLRERLESHVEQRMQMRERRMEAIRKQLQELETQHKQDLERREELVSDLLTSMLEDGDDTED